MGFEKYDARHRTALAEVSQDGGAERLEAKARRRRRLQLAVLALALLCTTTLGWAVSLLQTGRVTGLEDTTASVALTSLGSAIREGFPYVLYAIAFVILISNVPRLKGRPIKGLLPALLALVLLYIANAMTTQNITATLTFIGLVALIAVTLWSIGLELGDLVVLGRIGFGIAAISLIMAISTDIAWTDAGTESKGILTDATLAGFFPQMNGLGMSLVVTLPFVFMFRRRWARVTAFVAVTLALVLASSRSAIIAAAIGLAVGTLLYFVPRTSRIFWACVATFFIVAASVIVPVTAEQGAYTGRGDIWGASLTLIPQEPIFGHGPAAFAEGGAVTKLLGVAHWHGHNMWLTFMVIGGVVALIALVLFWIPALRRSFIIARAGSLVPTVALMSLLALGIAEVQIRPSEFDGVAWVSWLTLFAFSTLVTPPRVEQHILVEGQPCRS